jgi:glutamate/tyrosine decarboxylase-like PLP-dependent enzyme
VPDLSIVTYRYLPRPRPGASPDASGDAGTEASGDRGTDAGIDAFNDQLATRLQQDGSVFVSTARVRGRLVLRAAVSSFRTHRTDVDLAVETIRRTAERLVAG